MRYWTSSTGNPRRPAVSARCMGQSDERNVIIVLLFTLGSSAVLGLLCIPV